ncbi:PP2A regulatory subunit TAP46 [Apium graveolens]|uniref:PP2A regulatory subunit TAP46 n=1 Tax=Apium graveolens TaxID=4045 RepID=UPI003D7B2689
MGESKMEEMSLPSLFEQARTIHLLASESSADKEMVRKGCQALTQCEEMIGKLGLFSTNESKEDITTTNLKYILVPYYLAELTEKTVEGDRLQILKASLVKLKEFVSFCEAMELVPEEELEASAGGPKSNVDRRAKKIARFKRQRAAESKLLEIKESKERRMRSTRASALSTPVEAEEEDVLDYDGEEEREAWLITISLDICKAFDLMEMLKKEEEMLTAMKEMQLQDGDEGISQAILDERAKTAEDWHRGAAARARYTKPAAPITCATFVQDVLEGRAQVSQAHEHKHQQPLIFGPASLVGGRVTSERERMAAQVFQPGHRLPTMSIEEAGLTEMNMMNDWQERTAKMMAEANSSWYNDGQKAKQGEEEDEDDDAAQDKARAWDDWKDENPRGAGNKKLTPCG